MQRGRGLLLLITVIAGMILISYQIIAGEHSRSGAIALACFFGLIYLASWPPMRAAQGERPDSAARRWIGGMLIGLSWLARTALAMLVVFLVAGRNQHPVFDLRLAEFALTGSVLGMILLIGGRIAGIQPAARFTWARALVNIPIAVAIAGFAQPLKTAAYYTLCWAPLQVYHGLKSWLDVRWLAVLIDIPVWIAWLAITLFVISRIRRTVDRIFGPNNPVSWWLGDMRGSGNEDGVQVKAQLKIS